jgi:hypothetical protein
MLSDLAVRKMSPCDSSSSSYSKLRRVSDGRSSSQGSSPWRRRLTKTPSPEVHTATIDSELLYVCQFDYEDCCLLGHYSIQLG